MRIYDSFVNQSNSNFIKNSNIEKLLSIVLCHIRLIRGGPNLIDSQIINPQSSKLMCKYVVVMFVVLARLSYCRNATHLLIDEDV